MAAHDRGMSYLVLRVVRNKRGEVFCVVPRDDREGWDPHVSRHLSGQEHHKSFGQPFIVRRRQKLDQSFRGSENLVTMPVDADGLQVLGGASEFDSVFSIPLSDIRSDPPTLLAVDLTEPFEAPVVTNGARVIRQFNIIDQTPWIVVTLYAVRGPRSPAPVT